jgi:hypothetical protein
MLAANDPSYGSDERQATTDGGVVVATPDDPETAVPRSGDDERSSSSSSSPPAPSDREVGLSASSAPPVSYEPSSPPRFADRDVTAPVFDPPTVPRSEPLIAPHVDIPAPSPAPPFVGPPVPDELARPLGYPAPGTGPGLPPPRRERPLRKRRVTEGRRPAPDGRWVGHRLRHIGPWSVLKVASLFFFCLFLTFVVAIVLLWNVGRSTETIDQFEGFVTRLGAYGTCTPEGELQPGTAFERDDDCPDGEVLIDGFKLQDGTLFRVVFFGGVIIVVGGTVGTVLLTVLFNLLNDVTGGIRYTTIREPAGGSPPARSSRSSRSSRSPRHQARR